MPWDDDFLVDLESVTGLTADELVVVILDLPQNADERARRERQEAQERIEREAREASERGRALLLAALDDEQRVQFENRSRFFVTGSEGRRYCVHLGREHNVWAVDEHGNHTTNYCIHIRDRVPNEDNVLAQTLLLETNEPEFLRIANAR